MKKIKVYNNNNFLVGLRFPNTGTEKLVRKNAFIYLTDEEIQEINSASKLFQKGILHVESQEDNEALGYTEKNPNSLDEKEAEEILKLGNSQMKNRLSKITEDHAIRKFVNVIQRGSVDLTLAKLKIISDTLGVEQEDLVNADEI